MPKALDSPVPLKLPQTIASQLFAGAPSYRLQAGCALFRAGDLGDGCYWLEQGLLKELVHSPRGDEHIIALHGAAAIVGELSLIDGGPRCTSVVTTSASVLRFVSQQAFQRLQKIHPEIQQYLLGVVASRLREANQALAAATFLSVKGRVARAMLELAEHVGHTNGGGCVLRHKINQNELADMAGVARENVSRTLSEWRRRDLVTQSSQYYCIKDMGALAREM